MSRTVYHVVYEESKTYPWRVQRKNSSRDSSKHRKKSGAVRKAKNLAKKRKPSQVKVHKKMEDLTSKELMETIR